MRVGRENAHLLLLPAHRMSRISGLADMKKAAGGAPDDKKKKQNTLYTGGALS